MKNFRILIGRVLSALLIFLTLSQNIVSYADYSSYELQQVALSYLKKYSSSIAINNSEISLLSSLNNIGRFYMWTDYICNIDNRILSFSDKEKEYYSNLLYDRIETFNNTYKEPNGFTGLELPLFEKGKYPNDAQSILNSIAGYIANLYDSHLAVLEGLKSKEEKDTYYNDNHMVLDNAYLIILRLQQDYSFASTNVPFHTNKQPYVLNMNVFSEIIASTSKYRPILDYVISNIENTINTDTTVNLSEGNSYLDKFTKINDDGLKEEVVNNAYLVAFSASSLYMPISSKIGDNYVIDAINHLSEDSEVAKAYSEIAGYKKPLYLRNYDGNKLYGSGKAVTLGELINSVIYRKSGGLVTVEGKFKESADGDSYEMSTSNEVTRYESGSLAGTSTKKENNTETPNGEEEKDKVNKDNNGEKYYDEETGTLTVLGDTLGEGSNFSEPVFLYGPGVAGFTNTAAAAFTNTAVVTNYFLNNPILNLDGELAKSSALYVNPFGDIILSDNTVVIPAAANATYYADDPSVIYNPFTEMFMAGYPQINDGLVYETEDKGKNTGKYVFSTGVDTSTIDSLLKKCLVKMDAFNSDSNTANLLTSNGLSTRGIAGFNILTLDTGFYSFSDVTKTNIFIPEEKEFGGILSFFTNYATSNRRFYRLNYNTITADGVSTPLYPYGNAEGEEAIIRAKYLVESFYLSMVSSEEGVVNVNSGRINDKLLYRTLATALDGKPNTAGHQTAFYKNLLDSKSKGLFYFITKFIKDFANSIVTLFEDTPGILGVRPATQDYIMGNFLYMAKLAMPYILVITAIIILGIYLRRRVGPLFAIVSFIISLVVIFSAIYFLPKHISSVANFAVGGMSNELGFKTLAIRQEGNTGKVVDNSTFDGLGTFNFANSSINIYKLYDEEVEYLCKINGVDYAKIISGGAMILDDDTGLYLEGDSLKMNLDKFFNITSIVGKTEVVGNLATYALSAKKNMPSVVDYYMPYNLILNKFIEKLNKFSSIYQIPKAQNNYGDGYWKDSFLMDAFIHSPIFLAPDNYRDADKNMSDALYQKLVSEFTENNVDFLGLNEVLNEAFNLGNKREKETLWFNTMLQNGYFQETTESAEKYRHLVEYVNLQVKEFLISNKDYLVYMSDENIIELTCLWAVMSFNNEVKEFGNVLYPQTLNFHALSVTDILKATIVSDMNMFAIMDRSIVDYVDGNYSVIGLLGITVIVILSALSSILINFSFYILYLILLVFVIIRFIIGKKVNDAFMGFIKIVIALSAVTFFNIAGIKLIDDYCNSNLDLFFLFLMSTLTFGFISSILIYVITGLGTMDFGNVNVTSTIKSIKDKLNPLQRQNQKIHKAKLTTKNIQELSERNNYVNVDEEDVSFNSIALDSFLKERYDNPNVNKKQDSSRNSTFKRKRRRDVNSQSFTIDYDDDEILLD